MPLSHSHSPAATSRKARRGGKAARRNTPTVQLRVRHDHVTAGCCQQSSAALLLHIQPQSPP